ITDGPEPRQKRRDRRKVDRRKLSVRARFVTNPDVAMMHMSMHMPMPVMQAGQMKEAPEHRNQAQSKANNETEQVEIRPRRHDCSFTTCRSRSASPGVSRISASRMKHFRDSSWRATFKSASHNSGSPRKFSAPLINHKSRLCSSVRSSDINSVWNPS